METEVWVRPSARMHSLRRALIGRQRRSTARGAHGVLLRKKARWGAEAAPAGAFDSDWRARGGFR